MTEEKMMERMMERNKNPLEAWREILALFAEDDETVIKQKKRVDRALKRAEKKMREEGIEIWDGPEKDEYILESYPNVKKMIDEATMELAYYCKDNNDWDRFEKMILSNSFAMQITFDYLFNIIPDERKYSLTVNAYSWGGAAKEGVQNAIKKLPEYGKPELPDDTKWVPCSRPQMSFFSIPHLIWKSISQIPFHLHSVRRRRTHLSTEQG